MHPTRFAAPVALASVVLCSLLVPCRAHAAGQGLALSWNHCFGDAGAAQNAAFACDTNAGSDALVGSFMLASPFAGVGSMEIVVDLASASTVLPRWWEFRFGGACRQGSASGVFAPDPAETVCLDWSEGLAIGNIASYGTVSSPVLRPANTARFKLVSVVSPADAQDLLGDQSYFSFAIRIDHMNTVGSGACDGCSIPVCIVFNSIDVIESGGPLVGHRFISTPAAPGGNYVTWQGGGAPVGGGGIGCPAATASRRSTWSTVKTLYR